MKAWAGPLTTPELLKASEERLNSVIFRTDMFTRAPTDSRRFGLPEHMKKRIIRIIVTSSAIDKMFEIFGPIFEQNLLTYMGVFLFVNVSASCRDGSM